MKVYLAGPITNAGNYKASFESAEKKLIESGCQVMNPAILPEGFQHQEYMEICLKMIDPCDAVVFLPGWKQSKGACMEFEYASKQGKMLLEVKS